MQFVAWFVRPPVGRLDRRFRAAHPKGAALILVVALLVLLAMVGTAMVARARIDRYDSTQHTANTQIDLLLEGLVSLTQATVSGDLFDSAGRYRPALTTGYNNWDCPEGDAASGNNDTWLGERVPVLASALTTTWVTNHDYLVGDLVSLGGTTYISQAAHTSSAGNAPPGANWTAQSGDPVTWPASSIFLSGSTFDIPNSSNTYTQRRGLIPTSVSLGGGVALPGFTLATNANVIAADADGDGIADAGLFRLPVTPLAGVTYYGAVRIVDNNSAVNAATAWSQAEDYDSTDTASSALNQRMLPVNIGLKEMLIAAGEMNNLRDYRRGNIAASGVKVASGPQTSPTDDSGAARSDILFASQGEALWMQLGRRLENPGFNTSTVRYNALPITDSMSLAYRFCLVNSGSSPSLAESLLPSTLRTATQPRQPYKPGQVANWFSENFDYAGSSFSMRPLLVTRNPVSNAISPRYAPSTVTINFASTSSDYNGNGVQDDPLRDTATSNDNPTGMPAYSSAACKTSINTAPFEELWRSYWCVMAGYPTDQSPWGTTGSTTYDPYIASRPPFTHPQHMFRSPLRAPAPFTSNTQRIDGKYMMYLRAALAALNTIDMRDTDSDVTSRTIEADIQGDYKGNKGVYITLYGVEQQPYITEVYVQTDLAKVVGGNTNPKGYFAIELYNPYDNPISLKNWQLITNSTTLTTIAGFDTITSSATPPSVPAKGYLVLHNHKPIGASGNDARYVPASANIQSLSATCAWQYVAGLEGISNCDVIFVKPRRADGTLSKGFDGRNYDETKMYDLVPVDQFDFTGFPAPVGGSANLLHYCRASGTDASGNSNAWKFVYPGRYDAGKSPDKQRQDGTQQSSFVPNGAEPALTTPAKLGGFDPAASYSPTFTIQMATNAATAQQCSVSANPIVATGANMYPFGAFARNADILQVPFIGGYRVGVRQDNGNDKLKQILEMDAVTMDSSFADDADPSDDATESVGRFCPNGNDTGYAVGQATSATTTTLIDPNRKEATGYWINYDLSITSGTGAGQTRTVSAFNSSTGTLTVSSAFSPAPNNTSTYVLVRHYSWAARIFDYFTVLNPADDYLPNLTASGVIVPWNSNSIAYIVNDLISYNGIVYKCKTAHTSSSSPLPNASGNWQVLIPSPQSVANSSGATANGGVEDIAPVQGLINVNTAPWRVLAAVPWAADTTWNNNVAKSITRYRQINGPFRTLFELNTVPIYEFTPGINFGNYLCNFSETWWKSRGLMSVPDADDADGDFSPAGVNTDQARGDFEEQWLSLTRVSNLITTRSDSFTCYVVLQGWRSAGTANAALVTERRAAFLVDRSHVTAAFPGNLISTPVPTN